MFALLKIIFYQPLYNALVWLSAILPGHNLGLAVIILTVAVKAILLPLQRRVSYTQIRMKELEPKIKIIKEDHKDNTEQARKIMELYREHRVNPFFSILVLLIQLPVLLSLFYVFRAGFDFNSDLIYSFISAPALVNHWLLGLDLTAKSYVLAVLTGLTQFIQIRMITPTLPPASKDGKADIKQDLARSMQLQMRYVMPVIIAMVSLGLPAAVPLYWVTSNLFTIAQEWWFHRSLPKLPGTIIGAK